MKPKRSFFGIGFVLFVVIVAWALFYGGFFR